MRRGPAIGGHLPSVSKTELEQMSSSEQSAYHGRRADVFAARADFFARLVLPLATLAVAVLAVSLVLRFT